MRLDIPDLPEDASTQDRFLAIAQAVVTTTPAEATERERQGQEEREAKGLKKPGPSKGVAPKHKRKDG